MKYVIWALLGLMLSSCATLPPSAPMSGICKRGASNPDSFLCRQNGNSSQ